MNSLFQAIALLLSFSGFSLASVEFDRVFGSHMVLPQNKLIIFSGKAESSAPVTVTFSGKTVTCKPDQHKAWSASFPPQAANAQGQPATATQKEDKEMDIKLLPAPKGAGRSNTLPQALSR